MADRALLDIPSIFMLDALLHSSWVGLRRVAQKGSWGWQTVAIVKWIRDQGRYLSWGHHVPNVTLVLNWRNRVLVLLPKLQIFNLLWCHNFNAIVIDRLAEVRGNLSLKLAWLRDGLPAWELTVRGRLRDLFLVFDLSDRNFWNEVASALSWRSLAPFGLKIQGIAALLLRWDLFGVRAKDEVLRIEVSPQQLVIGMADVCARDRFGRLVVALQELKVLAATDVGVRGARASLIVVLRARGESLVLLGCNVGCHSLRASDFLRAVASHEFLNILILRVGSLQNEKWGPAMAWKLRESS